MWKYLIKTTEVKRRAVETISRKTLLRLRNFWYLVERLVQVPKDIILEPLTIGMMAGCGYFL